ncbi:SDR family NAD(P)-dependent oxidoreductase [Microbacterium sp. No. 7]|uniref:SDR family NAD(P)-dependent oxidoreductase n=1 Tax=Microbacterium sp. No. 7 TaxID=1714373 RepID=UPI0009EC2D8E|nr:SDR family NAD(P)-dependent oxidoreductase [Microbacterium sp. No. 7]
MLRFDGKVALITGGGRGLGRSHALLLASRGASIVINDLGGGLKGENPGHSAADAVVEEIVAAGGQAVANYGDVTTDAEAIVQAAIDAFGRLDIVINSAGMNVPAFASEENYVEIIRRHIDVNYNGTVAVTAAAWPHLVASGAGRVINTASPTLSGWEGQTPYVASKGAVFAYTRTLSIEALKQGIKVNAIAPTAWTRMAEAAEIPDSLKETLKTTMLTEMVSPMVAYFAHEECAVTGETWLTQGGLMQRFSLAMNDGYANPDATPEDIQAHIDEITDDSTAKPLGIIGTPGGATLLDLFE